MGDTANQVSGDPRWALITARNAGADETFVYAVSSTGIFCQPSCAARLPRPEHVCFYPSAEEARAAGFRPCKRCLPGGPSLREQHAAVIAEACRRIESSTGNVQLRRLAAAAGMSPAHFHRIFKALTGVTPKGYAAAQRSAAMRESLASSASVTEAIYESGFRASSRFYASAEKGLGMTPSTFRAGGASADIHFAVGQCSLGAILVAQTDRGICAILLGNDAEELIHDLERRFPQANLRGGDALYEQAVAQVIAFVEAPRDGLALPLDIRGTAFQQKVWQALRDLRPGATASYAAVAAGIGLPGSARAVAQACAANALAVAIPCHRVVRSDGGLSGYRWGIERKRALLAREAEQERPT